MLGQRHRQRQFHYGLTLISPPTLKPITLAEAKIHLRVDSNSTIEDEYIASLIDSVTLLMDGRTGMLGRQLITATWQLVLDRFPTNEIKIPFPPLQDINHIKYYDADGQYRTLSEDTYQIDRASFTGWVLPVSGTPWPETLDAINTVEVTYKAGYGDNPTDIPGPIKSAMKLWIGTLYEHREDISAGVPLYSLPDAIFALLAPFKTEMFI